MLFSCSLLEISSLKTYINLFLREAVSGKMLFLPKAVFLLKRDSDEKKDIRKENTKKQRTAPDEDHLLSQYLYNTQG